MPDNIITESRNLMGEAMRWFGPKDSVRLAEIQQTGATEVFSSLHEIPYGEAWPQDMITRRRDEIAASGLRWTVVESVPVSEEIKTRSGDFERHIENYKTTLRHLGNSGIHVVVYNFMPVLDWVRTDLGFRLPDGSEALLYDPSRFAAFDIFALRRPGAEADYSPDQRADAAWFWAQLNVTERNAFVQQTLNLFPGVRLGMTLDCLRRLLRPYARINGNCLRDHLRMFLEAVIPVAIDSGVRLAIHPDDPPFGILGLPRIVSCERDLAEILAMVDRRENGLCYCTGSLSVRADNDLVGIIDRFGSRINTVHLRSVQREASGVFYEANHLEGSMDMAAVVTALLKEQGCRRQKRDASWRLTFRPDHGHMLLDDFKRTPPACPGYPLIGRLRGLAEIRGLQVGISHALECV